MSIDEDFNSGKVEHMLDSGIRKQAGLVGLFLIVLLTLVFGCGGSGGGGGDSGNNGDDSNSGTTTYTVGGTVTGLVGELVLQNNGSDNLSIDENGIFTFNRGLLNGANYSVTIDRGPDEQTCQVSNGSGIINESDINNINVTCSTTLSMNIALKGIYDKNLRWPTEFIKHGDYLYVGEESGVKIFNISDPNTIAFESLYTGAKWSLKFADTTAFITHDEELHIVDLSSPDSPQLMEVYDVGDVIAGLATDSNYVYLTTVYSRNFQIIDFSNPSNPLLKGSLNINFLGEIYDVKGDYAYLSGSDSLQIIDISDPTDPSFLGSYQLYQYINRIVVSGDYAYIAGSIDVDDNRGLTILDISDPNNPVFVFKGQTDGYAFDVVVDGSYAYMADGDEGLEIFDVSNPATSFKIVHSEMERINRLHFESGFLYALGTRSFNNSPVISIIDVSNPAMPTTVSTHFNTNQGKDMAFQGNYLILSNEGDYDLQVIDISDPAVPVLTAQSSAPSPTHYFNTSDSLITRGTYAYQTGEASSFNSEYGIRLWDLTDPVHPAFVKIFSGGGVPRWVSSLFIENNNAYLSSPGHGLAICEITDPEAFDCVTFTSDPFESLYEFNVIGTRAYAVGDHNIHIFDLSNPKLPLLMGSYQTNYFQSDIFVEGDYLYILDDPIEIVDISDPRDPILVGQYAGVSGSYATLVGNRLYVARHLGLAVFDVSDPSKPKIIGKYDMLGGSIRVKVVGNHIYVLLQHGGVRVLEEL